MKKSAYLGIAVALAGTVALSSCQADMDNPGLQVPEANIQANTTILDLKQKFENKSVFFVSPNKVVDYSSIEPIDEKDKENLAPDEILIPGYELTVSDPNAESGLKTEFFKGKVIDEGNYVIKGRVVSSDATGNIYKSLVIQDETAALAFSINQGSLYNEYRLGQEVVVDMTGMHLGYYRGLQQVGSPGDPDNGQPQLGFMSIDYWKHNAQLNGIPNPDFKLVPFGNPYPADEYYCISFDDFDQLTGATLPAMQSQLVEFRNVSFKIKEGEETYAPYEESVNRTLVDANGKTMIVRNSGYSNFYNQKLPEGRGIVRGILSYYNSDWQIVLRSLDDVMITTKGGEEEPFSVADVLGGEYAGISGWTKGYVVGSVKAGITTVSGAADVIFGADAEMDNNVLIAADASETDLSKCAVVELPQNTQLRAWVNLIDNPDVYKKELLVKGTLGEDLGLKGVVNSRGSFDDFKIDGRSMIGGIEPPAPSGTGTESDPYNIAYVMQTTADESDVWVTGYVQGYVASGDFADGAEYSANEVAGSTNYLNSTNVILSAVTTKCGFANSVPAQLSAASRPVLGLKLNPGIFGRQVKVKCRITDYLGTRGIRSISEVVEL